MDSISIRYAGFLVFLALMGVGRVLAERALRHLSAEEKVRLIDGFSSLRVVIWLPSLVLAAVVYAIQRWWPGHALETVVFMLSCVLGLMVATYAVVFRRLRALSLPEAYIQRFLTARLLTLTGALILIATLVHPVLEASQ